MDKIHINIIGGGNVATHLIREFLKHPEIHLQQLYARNLDQLKEFEGIATLINDLNLLTPADITIVAVSDDAIASIARQLENYPSLVVHTSGSKSMEELQNLEKGVFYPFQSFSKERKQINFKNVPVLIEAENPENLEKLTFLGNILSDKVYEMNSSQRKALHIAGVFAANFTNHMYVLAHQIMKENNIPFDLIVPLIHEVAEKVSNLPPIEAQTGPAVRNDLKTIEEHLAALDKSKKKIYELLTQSIIENKNLK